MWWWRRTHGATVPLPVNSASLVSLSTAERSLQSDANSPIQPNLRYSPRLAHGILSLSCLGLFHYQRSSRLANRRGTFYTYYEGPPVKVYGRFKGSTSLFYISVSSRTCSQTCYPISPIYITAEAPLEAPKVHLDMFTKRTFKEVEVEMPNLDKKPSFQFPLRDRFIQERDAFKLTCAVDVDTYPAPTVRETPDLRACHTMANLQKKNRE